MHDLFAWYRVDGQILHPILREQLDALEEASVEQNLEPFERVVAAAVNESLDRYLSWIGGPDKPD